jgi:hypothetical protein
MRRLLVSLLTRLAFIGIDKNAVCRCYTTTWQCQKDFLTYGVKCCVRCNVEGPMKTHNLNPRKGLSLRGSGRTIYYKRSAVHSDSQADLDSLGYQGLSDKQWDELVE